MKRLSYTAETIKGIFYFAAKEEEGKKILDSVWIQKNDGTKEFYRMNPQGAELKLTPKVFGEALEALFINEPKAIDDIKSWVIDDHEFLEAMIEAYSKFMYPLVHNGLYALITR